MMTATIYAKGLQSMVDWYRELFEMDVADEGETFTTVTTEAITLTVVQIPAEIANTFSLEVPPVARVDAAIKLSFVVSDLEAAKARVRRHGGIADTGAGFVWNGNLHVNVVDPEGNVVELISSQ